RECPFPDCEWAYEYAPDYDGRLEADFRSEMHYEREHAGEVRIKVTLETAQLLGDRNPMAVAEHAHERFADKTTAGYEVAYACAEVTEEADDHSVLAEDDDAE
ncbi:hypothetical protein CP556_21385, partial [Natrinema sp. CBA1119]|uniref:hypothetical protein n=1 Tax=Natrinema sp. CBA1119 TaxID=1608465 RepID=UPI000C01353B